MHLYSIVAAALLPLLAVAQTTTLTSTMTMTKTITLGKSEVTGFSAASVNSTSSSFLPTGTGSTILPTTSLAPGESGSLASPSSGVVPTIDNNSGMSLGAAHVAFAGVAGMVVVALM